MSVISVALLKLTLAWGVSVATPVCFPDVGCFSMGPPWVSRYRPAKEPLPPAELPLVLDFYTREIADGMFNVNLTEVPMKPSRPTVVITHGHDDDANVLWMRSLKDAYLDQVDANIVILDWVAGSSGFHYDQAAANIRVIGRLMAIHLKNTAVKHGLAPKDFHFIGEGLGAHMMGYIAKEFPGTGRITGLDPSREYFEYFDSLTRLDKYDAIFVDVIHTSSRLLLPNTGFGLTQPIGHVDFYVNIGEYQPGCEPVIHNATNDITELQWMSADDSTRSEECNHKKAREYFLQAMWRINNCTFWGHKRSNGRVLERVLGGPGPGNPNRVMSKICTPQTCTPLGLNTPKRPARGAFFIRTRHTSPYCIPHRIVQPPKARAVLRGMVNTISSNVSGRKT